MKIQTLILLLNLCLLNCYSQTYEIYDEDAFSCPEGSEECFILKADNDGTYKYYSNPDQLVFIAEIKNKKFDGSFEMFWNDSTTYFKGQYSKGKRTGKWYYYDGKIIDKQLEFNGDTVTISNYIYDHCNNIVCIDIEVILNYNDTLRERKIANRTNCIRTIDKKHSRIIEKFNDRVSNKWKLTICSFEPGFWYGLNTQWFEIITPLTENSRGGNSGVSLFLVDKKYKDHIMSLNPKEHCYFETKSYFIFTSQVENWKIDLVQILCNELQLFFDENKEKL
jgi:hypothetical protein